MPHPKVTPEEMNQRIIRFTELKKQGTPLMFIDSVIPRHYRMNYAVIGDTASENPEFKPLLNQPHKFQIGVVNAPPGCGPAYHTHDYIEMFMPLTGRWRYYYGNDPEGAPEGEAILEPWDMISLPPGLWRGFENISDEPAWLFAVLEPHEVFAGKDPYWAQHIVQQAEAFGFHADERGKMVKPENYAEHRQRVEALLLKGIQ
ncbi:MAG: cupin domain-containing protein [Anaerolineales bacterium]